MSSRTTNIGLEKVTSDQTIGDLQESMNGSGGNMDIIDTKMGPVGNTSLQAQVNALNSKIANIGDYVTTTSQTTNVSSGNTFHVIDTITPGEGYYLIISNVSFENNAVDARSASLSLDSNADPAWFVNEMASPTGSTTLQIVRFHAFSAQQSMNLLVRQLSNVALDVTCRTFAIKLK